MIRPRRGTEGHTQGNLFPPPCRSREQQIRDVGASDQEDKRNRTHQHQKRRARGTGYLLAQRRDPRRPARISDWILAD
jgi:hypothetical protein